MTEVEHAVLGTFVPNPEQRDVIEAEADDWLLVVAGPGTGKTQVAAMRLVHLLNSGLRPAQILVLSFSRSAVTTLTRRVAGLRLVDEVLMEDLRHLAIRTFDSWTFRMLRQGGGAVPELLARSYEGNIVALTDALADGGNADIEIRLKGIRHVIVDEFQDLPGVRARMVIELLSRLNHDGTPRVGFTVLGDPAQAIYRFANRACDHPFSSDPWEDLKARMGGKLREVALIRNHRSTEKLATMASSMRKILQSEIQTPQKKLAAMQRFLERLPALSAEAKLGPGLLVDRPSGTLAILTRTNGEALRVAMMIQGESVEGPVVPVRLRLAGNRPSVPAWIAVLLARFKPKTLSRATFEIVHDKIELDEGDPARAALQIPSRDVAWRRLARASGASDSESSIDLDVLRERLDWPDAFPDDQASENAVVYITTVHQAKGMEFDNVALLDAHKREVESQDPLEEANVGFVAITRAGKTLGRIPETCIYKAPYEWQFKSGRSRQMAWGGMNSLQIGLQGDIEAESFVDTAIHGGEAQVRQLQDDLMRKASDMRGHKVILVRVNSVEGSSRARDVHYDIHLQNGKQAGLLLARTSQQVTFDLLDMLWDKGCSLPNRIFNLRINDVVTITGHGDPNQSIPDPWRSSRLWLGVTLSGTGDFKTWRRNGG
jgi:DNA helicase-2/ATP-dependent DNA helicase PcrA